MAQTLLDVVQGILSTLDSDTVSSISDTVEADQIADVVKHAYDDIVTEYNLAGKRELGTLEGLSDPDKPNLLRIPENVLKIIHWQYDTGETLEAAFRYQPVEYKVPSEFLHYVNSRDSSDQDKYKVIYVQPTIPVVVDYHAAPRYWTSFDDKHICTCSYNVDVESSLQAAKTQAWLERHNAFVKADNFVIDLPRNLEQLLFRTAEGEAYALFKQTVNPKLEQKESRLRIRAQRNKHRTNEYEVNPLTVPLIMEENEVLTRDKAIPKNILPTGRKVGIVPVKGTAFVELAYVDGKGGTIHNEYASQYTGVHYAEKALKKYLSDFWDLADKSGKKKNNAVG